MSELSRYQLRCRRGMKELDVVLVRYLERHFAQADAAEKSQLDQLLALQDPQLFGILFGVESVPEVWQELVKKIRAFS